MKLIDNWRRWPRMYSQWAAAAIMGLQTGVMVYLTPEQLAAPTFLWDYTWGQLASGVTAALAVSGFIGRLISQDLQK
jgi:hypothetical protein